jgi:hypothetical protein
MGRDLTRGTWFDIASEQEWKQVVAYGKKTGDFAASRVRLGDYEGPGKYMLFRYTQRCPRNCCDDTVYELLSASAVQRVVREEIQELAGVLKEARANHGRQPNSTHDGSGQP